MRDKNITVLFHRPGFWRAIHDSAELFPSLRLVVVQGEMTYRADLDAIQRRAAGAEIVCLHGVAELPHCYTAYTYANSSKAELPLVLPLGRGIGGTEALLLSRAGKVAAFGELAELCFQPIRRGARADAQDEIERGDIVRFHTGIMGRYAIDGTIEYVGGCGSSSMVRGYRIEHALVEAVLMQHPRVLTASVKLDAEGRLAAFIVRKTLPAGKATQGFQQFLKDMIPEYMRPEVFIVTDASHASIRPHAPQLPAH